MQCISARDEHESTNQAQPDQKFKTQSTQLCRVTSSTRKFFKILTFQLGSIFFLNCQSEGVTSHFMKRKFRVRIFDNSQRNYLFKSV